MPVPRESLRAAVVVCPVRAAAAVVRLVVGRELWDHALVVRADPQRVVDEEAEAWEQGWCSGCGATDPLECELTPDCF